MRTKAAILIMLTLILSGGCGGTFRRPADEESSRKAAPALNGYPLDLSADTVIVPLLYPFSSSGEITPLLNGAGIDSTRALSNLPKGFQESYRIQLFTSKIYGPALKEYNIATQVFDERVWMDYDVPYYKVRVGDFATREKAEKYLSTVKVAGYDAAWVVKVNANIRSIERNVSDERGFSSDTSDTFKPAAESDNDSSSHPGH